MGAPDGRQAIVKRKLRIACGRDVQDGEIFLSKRVRKTAERGEDQEKLPACRRLRHGHQRRVPDCRTVDRENALHHGNAQGKNQRKMTDLWNHSESFVP